MQRVYMLSATHMLVTGCLPPPRLTTSPPLPPLHHRYISLIVAGVVFVDLSLRTLPLYSLAVQMGSEFKHRECVGRCYVLLPAQ